MGFSDDRTKQQRIEAARAEKLAKREQARENLKTLAAVGNGKIGVDELAILYGAPSSDVIYTAISDRKTGKPNPRGPNVRPPFKEGTRDKWWYRDILVDIDKERRSSKL